MKTYPTTPITAALLTLLLLASSLLGCGDSSAPVPSRSGPVTSRPRQFGSLQFTLSAPKATYAFGEAVPLTLAIKNVGTQPLSMVRASSQLYDIQVTQGEMVVWQQSLVSTYHKSVDMMVFAPNETKIYSVDTVKSPEATSWRQKDLQGSPVPAGQYTIRFWLTPGTMNGAAITDAEQDCTSYSITIMVAS